jgi:hypothetical protein
LCLVRQFKEEGRPINVHYGFCKTSLGHTQTDQVFGKDASVGRDDCGRHVLVEIDWFFENCMGGLGHQGTAR